MTVVRPTAAFLIGQFPRVGVVSVTGDRPADGDDESRVGADDDLVVGRVPVALRLLGNRVIPRGDQSAVPAPSGIRSSRGRHHSRPLRTGSAPSRRTAVTNLPNCRGLSPHRCGTGSSGRATVGATHVATWCSWSTEGTPAARTAPRVRTVLAVAAGPVRTRPTLTYSGTDRPSVGRSVTALHAKRRQGQAVRANHHMPCPGPDMSGTCHSESLPLTCSASFECRSGPGAHPAWRH